MPGVRNFGSHIGRAEVADEVVGPNFTELWISVDPKADHDHAMAQVQAVVDGYPGLFHDVLTYLKERIKEVLTGAGATVVVRIFGPDLAVLRDKAQEVGRGDEGGSGGDEPEGRAADRRAAARRQASPRGRRPARPDARRRPPLGDHAGQRPRSASCTRTRRSSTCSSGASSRLRNDVCAALRPADRDAAGDARSPGRRGRRVDRAGAERDQARGGLAPDRRDLQRRGARPGERRPRDRGQGPQALVPPRVPPRVPRRVRRARRVAATA